MATERRMNEKVAELEKKSPPLHNEASQETVEASVEKVSVAKEEEAEVPEKFARSTRESCSIASMMKEKVATPKEKT